MRQARKYQGMMLTTILSTTLALSTTQLQREAVCNFPLGVEDGSIRDEDITATDSHVESSAAHFGRLNSEEGAGAWCHASIDKDNRDEYIQVKLNGLAEVNLIALQGRFNGRESVQLVQVNVSLDGAEWETAAEVTGPNEQEPLAHRPIEPVHARYVRLIPITDRKMPVCIRTELFGCYHTDDLVHYKLSKEANEENAGMTLANNDLTDWVTFGPDQLEIVFQWETPINVSQVLLYTKPQNESCLKKVTIITTERVLVFTGKCTSGVISIEFDGFYSDLTIKLEYSGQLTISEIEWSNEFKTVENMVQYGLLSTENSTQQALLGKSFVFVGLLAIGAIFIAFLLFALVFCSCRRYRTNKGASYSQASTTLREGTWTMVRVPHQEQYNEQNEHYNRRSEQFINRQMFPSPTPVSAVSLPSYKRSYPGTKVDYNNEYSEIGSITADSGRGDSLTDNTDEKHYAQVAY